VYLKIPLLNSAALNSESLNVFSHLQNKQIETLAFSEKQQQEAVKRPFGYQVNQSGDVCE